MSVPEYRRSHFDSAEEDAMGPLANLTDIMLVFAVGLMVALAASQRDAETQRTEAQSGTSVEAGRELPEMPAGVNEAGSGYETVGRVYRDPESGQLILVDEES